MTIQNGLLPAGDPPKFRTLSIGALTILALGVLSILPIVTRQPPVETTPAEFSVERALEHITSIAAEPHPMGSAANARVRSYLEKELTALGLNRLGLCHLAVAAQHADVLRDRVDAATQLVALAGDLAQQNVERRSTIDRLGHGRVVAPRQCGTNTIEVIANQPYVDHESEAIGRSSAGPGRIERGAGRS